MRDSLKWIWQASNRAIEAWQILSWLVPAGILSAMTAYLAAYFSTIPIPPHEIILLSLGAFCLTSLSFAAVYTALLRQSEWRDLRLVNGKIHFTAVRVARNIKGPGMIMGVNLSSTSAVQMELRLIEVMTRLNDRVPPKIPIDLPTILVPPNGVAWFEDHVIDIGEPPRSGTVEGFLEFKIKYGHPGSLDYDLIIKKKVVVAFNAEGLFTEFVWGDAA